MHLDGLVLPRIVPCWLNASRGRLWLGTDRSWQLETATGTVAVLLLRHKSFWWQAVAGITLQTPDSEHLVLWLVRRGRCPAWRRMRVHFRYP